MPGTPPDPVQAALDNMADAADRVVVQSRQLAHDSRLASEERAGGTPAGAAMSSGQWPRILQMSGEIARTVLSASAGLRRALVRQLHIEGFRTSSISRMFGVSHQRVTTLMREHGGRQR